MTPNEGVQVDPRTPRSSLKVFLKPGGARIALAEVTRDNKERPVLPPIRYLSQSDELRPRVPQTADNVPRKRERLQMLKIIIISPC